tara:strand:+ start:250 stop:537 length:288 start_codon:yes stop_codon:yes gene_type:complete
MQQQQLQAAQQLYQQQQQQAQQQQQQQQQQWQPEAAFTNPYSSAPPQSAGQGPPSSQMSLAPEWAPQSQAVNPDGGDSKGPFGYSSGGFGSLFRV